MQLKVFGSPNQTFIAMKLLILLITAACLQVCATGYGQSLTLSLKNASLEKAFKEIKQQSGYSFIYTREQLKNAPPVTLNVKNADLKEVLDLCFANQALTFLIEDHYIIVQTKPVIASPGINQNPPIDLTGRVVNENNEPVVGASIKIKGTDIGTSTDASGEFSLKNLKPADILIVSGAEMQPMEIRVGNRNVIEIKVNVKVNELDKVVMMAYGHTTKRLNTGNISKVTAEEISKQPVTNPLAALQARVPGLVVTQANGLPGSAIYVQVRGQNSLTQGSEPLFIIDGVPFAPNNSTISQLGSILTAQNGSGMSPFNTINPSDIESIEVLKDADATAIYGSRGANGVILITTKKGKAGKTKITASTAYGISKVTRTMQMFNTKQYLQMRREAFANDGLVPNAIAGSPGYAPDLLIWDTTRYTDWQKFFWGSNANRLDANVSLSGGNNQTQFLIGTSYHNETTVFPGDLHYQRGTLNVSIDHASLNKKVSISFRNNSSIDRNNLISVSGPQFVNTPPNAPPIFDASGKLIWSEHGIPVENPYSALLKPYNAETENSLTNLQFAYKLFTGFTARLSMGYNSLNIDEKTIEPIASKNPDLNPTGSLDLSTSNFKSWIIEPQAEYVRSVKKLKLLVLLGGTLQEQIRSGHTIRTEGYTTDDLLQSLGSGTITYKSNNYTKYRYNAAFARVNLNLSDKYIINLSGRRDGSSRFGPGRQFANFGAGGVVWIFSKEAFFQEALHFVSFGKLRGSYGITGNDQIGDYQYLDSWSATNTENSTYQGVYGLSPTRLFNADYGWEVNRKFEAALDLGFIKDRLLFSIAYYRNTSDNQLVNYKLPSQAGFSSVNRNLPALIQNTGWEIETNATNINTKNWNWKTLFNISIPRNRLLSFPDIEESSYASSYVLGQPLSVIYKLESLGVDPQTGIFYFRDANADGVIKTGFNQDYKVLGYTSPRFYGGITNIISYKKLTLDFVLEFREQNGLTYMSSIYRQQVYMPGTMFNQSVNVLDRWQKPGDVATTQRYTATTSSAAYKIASMFTSSNGIYGTTSFIRLKTFSLTCMLPDRWIDDLKIESGSIYIRGQNLFTITNYKGADPENQNLFAMPLLKTFAAGIQLTF